MIGKFGGGTQRAKYQVMDLPERVLLQTLSMSFLPHAVNVMLWMKERK
jgi:hypothetical protein